MKSPVALRRALVRWLRSVRDPRLGPAPTAGDPPPRFVTWPRVSRPVDLRDLTERVRWFLPPFDTAADVLVPTTSDRQPLSTLLSSGGSSAASPAIVLLWRVRSWGLLSALAARRTPFFIIDPTLYASTEETEWLALYARHATARHVRSLRASADENFLRLVRHAAPRQRVNVCGNGPHLQDIYDRDVQSDVNIVCNAAVQSDRLLDHLRPTAIAFVNSPYFGPSDWARDHMRRIQRCVDAYGSFLVIPEGYAHHLVRTHYPALASRIIALQFGRDLTIPSHGALDVQATANVLTSLMLPLAAALSPSVIQVWGCDGQPPSRRGTWAYLPGLEPRIESVADKHPAFVEGLRTDDHYLRQTYDTHADGLERLLSHLEMHGHRIICASPSAMPALARRSPPPAPPASARSSHSAPLRRIR
jgi:hypothetical protein